MVETDIDQNRSAFPICQGCRVFVPGMDLSLLSWKPWHYTYDNSHSEFVTNVGINPALSPEEKIKYCILIESHFAFDMSPITTILDRRVSSVEYRSYLLISKAMAFYLKFWFKCAFYQLIKLFEYEYWITCTSTQLQINFIWSRVVSIAVRFSFKCSHGVHKHYDHSFSLLQDCNWRS